MIIIELWKLKLMSHLNLTQETMSFSKNITVSTYLYTVPQIDSYN